MITKDQVWFLWFIFNALLIIYAVNSGNEENYLYFIPAFTTGGILLIKAVKELWEVLGESK